MGAVYFYQLSRAPLEMTLPMLLGKARGAGWRVAVRGTSADHLKWLDEKLWLGDEADFSPHGIAGGDFDKEQPILLTTSAESPNGATCIMAVEGADVSGEEVNAMERVCIIFDGNTPEALDKARGQWKQLTDAGCSAQYWSQESGTWEKKAESN